MKKVSDIVDWYKQNAEVEPKLGKIAAYLKNRSCSFPAGEDIVLVSSMDKAFYLGLFGIVTSALKKKRALRLEQYVPRSFLIGEFKSPAVFAVSRLLSPFHIKKWISLYASFCDAPGFRNNSLNPLGDFVDGIRAWKSWRKIDKKEELVNFEIDGVVVGDLVIDTCLRYKPAPTFEVKDIYLWIVLWQTYRNWRRAVHYFSNKKPKLYLTAYSTYIDHGIPVRVALRYGTRVFAFGEPLGFAKELVTGDWMHTKTTRHYAETFSKLDGQDEKLEAAERALQFRFSGGIDAATGYMKQSAYTITERRIPDIKNAVVIFLHDFYDSPHCYGEMVFTDFWEWICFTVETLQNADMPFFVKPHPNQIPLNEQVLKKLQDRYPYIRMISSSITNVQLADAGMACAVTVYGTVAHEMAYLGVPVICCAENPHDSFDFCNLAHSRDEYAEMLRNAGTLLRNESDMRQQSLAFYYMHNLYVSGNMKELRDCSNKLMKLCDQQVDGSSLVEGFETMSRLPGFRDYISDLL